MPEPVILIGGSGHAKVVMDCVQSSGGRVAGILDDGIAAGTLLLGVPVLGKVGDYAQYLQYSFLIAIGSNAIRRRIAENLPVKWCTAVHPSAVVSQYAHIEAGSVVMPHTVVNSGASIGMHCIVNSGAIIEHDSRLADYVHISPGASLGGTVFVGEETHVGIGASVRNNISICGGCTIGAGAVVVKNITEPGTYVGVPVRRIK